MSHIVGVSDCMYRAHGWTPLVCVLGGCGSMFKIHVESPEFQGKGLVAQQRMVNSVLKTEIASMHGLTLSTKATPASS